MNQFMRHLLALPEQASSVAASVDHLHYAVITATMVGSFFVFLTGFVFVVKYRRRSEDELTPRIDVPWMLEGTWIVLLLGLFLAFWVVGFKQYVIIETPPKKAMNVYVTGKQWMWKFSYPDGRSSTSVLTVPVNTNVKLNMTSRDVVHSFYVPAFRIKQDVIPGRYTTAWFKATKPGVYQLFCAEYCGVSHSQMWGNIVVLSSKDYARWRDGELPALQVYGNETAEQPADVAAPPGAAVNRAPDTTMAPPETMAQRGREVATREGCMNCHTLDGRPHIGPSWYHLYNTMVPLSNGKQVYADEAYLTKSMMDPMADIVAGYQPVMPTYQGILQAPDAAAIVEFIKTLRDHKGTGAPSLPKVVAPAAPPARTATGALVKPPPATVPAPREVPHTKPSTPSNGSKQ